LIWPHFSEEGVKRFFFSNCTDSLPYTTAPGAIAGEEKRGKEREKESKRGMSASERFH